MNIYDNTMNNNGNYNTTIDARATTNSLKYVCEKTKSLHLLYLETCNIYRQNPCVILKE